MSHAIPATISSATPEEITPAKPRRRRWKLATRLIVTVVGIVSLILVMISAASATVLASTLDNELRANVAALGDKPAAAVTLALSKGAENATEVLDQVRGEPGIVLLMQTPNTAGGYNASGAKMNPDYTTTTLTSDAASAAIATIVHRIGADMGGPGEATTMTDLNIDGAGVYRATIVRVGTGSVVLGLPLSSVQDQISRLLWTIGLLTVGGLLVLALATALVIRSGLRPLRDVVATAEHVASLQLDKGEVAIIDRVADEAVDDHTEIGRVGAALNTMLDHVDDSLQARARNEELMRRFVADASHELRTPLASIRGYSELSLRASDNPEPTTTALERIQAQSLRMTRLVEDLLLLARLDEGQEIVLGHVDLTPLVIDAVSDAKAAGPDHHWAIDVSGESLMVTGDAGRLNQVVTNLLANARTHTAAGTTVTLSLRHEPGFAVIDVHDDGEGIDPSVRDGLFDRFSRADKSRARKTGGTGLGLSIAKAIADAHHGSLSVRSVPGDTTFTFRLPLAAVTGTSVAPPAA